MVSNRGLAKADRHPIARRSAESGSLNVALGLWRPGTDELRGEAFIFLAAFIWPRRRATHYTERIVHEKRSLPAAR